MKTRMLYFITLLAGLAITFWSASGGPAAVQGADRTGSPLSNNSSCATCHNNGNFSPSLSAQLLDGNETVTAYEPGKTYTLRVAVNNADAASAYGFQAVLLSGDDNANAGTFGDPPSGIQVTPLNNRMYAEHSDPSNDNVFTIPWTAPASGTGEVRLYAGGNAVNGNGSTGGDNGLALNNPVRIGEAGASRAAEELTFSRLELAPNPTAATIYLTLDNDRPGRYELQLFTTTGQRVQRSILDLGQGVQSYPIELADLPKGLYFLHLTDGERILSRSILKQ